MFFSYGFLWFVLLMGPSGLMAILAGWFTTEIGRQPWVVYGIQRTRDAVSAHGSLYMSFSLLAFILVYSAVFGVGYLYMMQLIKKGPVSGEGQHHEEGGPGQLRTPARPLSASSQQAGARHD